jgi:hypothetical protein
MSECLVFQKMSEQDIYILKILDMLRETGELEAVEDEKCLYEEEEEEEEEDEDEEEDEEEEEEEEEDKY